MVEERQPSSRLWKIQVLLPVIAARLAAKEDIDQEILSLEGLLENTGYIQAAIRFRHVIENYATHGYRGKLLKRAQKMHVRMCSSISRTAIESLLKLL